LEKEIMREGLPNLKGYKWAYQGKKYTVASKSLMSLVVTIIENKRRRNV
jgi:hypothetical protein